tara:strand:- start:564 stop:1175 length:612 start_codon:yes stop_codon:yes gene_type:complete
MKLTLILLASSLLTPSSVLAEELFHKFPNSENISTKTNLVAAWNPVKNKTSSKTGAKEKTKLTLESFKSMPELQPYFKNAKGYAVFPTVGKGGVGIGGARGKGEVFLDDKVIGSTTLTQVSIGFQLGGQAFSQIIFFKGKRDLNRFIEGNFEFGASASAALINSGAAVETAYSNGVAVLTVSKGGLMYEASIGGQKFSYEPYN